MSTFLSFNAKYKIESESEFRLWRYTTTFSLWRYTTNEIWKYFLIIFKRIITSKLALWPVADSVSLKSVIQCVKGLYMGMIASTTYNFPLFSDTRVGCQEECYTSMLKGEIYQWNWISIKKF